MTSVISPLSTAKAANAPVSTAAQRGISAERVERSAAEESKPSWQQGKFWQVVGSTFITIFLAELGDKTQVSTLLMSAEFHNPWVIFAGAASALVTTSLLGVLLGRWLSSRVSPRTLDVAAGLTLALISLSLLWEVFTSF